MKMRSHTLIGVLIFSAAICLTAVGTQTAESSAVEALPWPDTPAGRCAQAFFDALATDGTDALRQFTEEHYPEGTSIEETLANHLQLRELAGELTFHSASADGDHAVVVFARSELFGWMRFRIELSPELPHRVTAMRGEPGSPPEAQVREVYGNWQDLRDLSEQIRDDSGAPGMVAAVVRGGQIVERATTGVRRVGQPEDVRISDLFHIGSLTKIFTGATIGKLLQEGTVRWDMTIGEALPDIAMRDEYRTVTLEQLLGHRGGIPNLPTMGEFTDGFPVKPGQSPADARAALVRQVLTEEPTVSGEYDYSNSGYVVAATMVERATGESWEDLVRTLVFEPLDLSSAGFGWPATSDRPDQPRGHYGASPNLDVQEIGEYMLGDMNCLGPAGNLHCSIEDLARFAVFLLNVLDGGDSTLSPETLARFWRAGETDEGERTYGFFGSGGTFMAMIALYPDSDLAIVAAANYGLPMMPFFEKMGEAIHERMAGAASEPPADAGVEWPDTIAARRAKAFVTALNAGDEESLRRFVTDNYSPASLEQESIEDQIAPYKAIAAQIGALIVRSVESDGGLSAVVVGESDSIGMWFEFILEMEDEPPHYWAGWTGRPTAGP